MIELLKHIALILIISQIILFIFENLFGYKSELNNYVFIVLCMVVVMLIITSIPEIKLNLGLVYNDEKYDFTIYDYDEYLQKYKDLIINNIE